MFKKYLFLGIAIASALGGAYITKLYWSNKYDHLVIQLQEAEKKNMQFVLDVERLQREKASAIERELAAKEVKREQKVKVVTKKVIQYVTQNSNSFFKLDDDWLRIHDAATPVPQVAGSSRETDATGEKVRDLGNALQVVTQNYAACQDSVDRLTAWQDWYKSVSKHD